LKLRCAIFWLTRGRRRLAETAAVAEHTLEIGRPFAGPATTTITDQSYDEIAFSVLHAALAISHTWEDFHKVGELYEEK
jgi:hypothetical protein